MIKKKKKIVGDSKIKKESLSEGIVSCALIASCVMWLLPTGDHAAREKKQQQQKQQQQKESNMSIVYMSSLHIERYEIRMY
jgi:hypothetical protein